jgi:ribosomal protein L11 methyltransferase
VRVEPGSVDDADRGRYDLVLANILAEVVARLAPDLARHTAAGGWLVASGILDARVAVVERALAETGLDIVRRWQSGDWLALGARHSGG